MAIWDSKKYNRINWKNRPSTATALGATNLNKVDVFCNEVDNALIQMDAGKLDIATANSMLASVSFDQDTGVFTFKELDGTTYTYDLNLEKIPVSFTLTEEGILIMTTEDGTEWECNIADLIKDYVFDDSETITFEKEFVGTDDEGKGSYHVSASVKAGSINETHLDPDYRADILTYKTQAQEAANDSLTYSKDSQRWAVGSAEYEGSATDNAKYYKEQAEAAKSAAETARDEAQAATGRVIMAPGVLGVGKPDNTTIEVTSDGTISAKEATSTSPGISRPDGTTLGVEEGVMKMIADATSLLITDNQELVVEKVGDVAQKTTTQLLIDSIAQKVANELVTNSALTTTLANYVTKAMMSNVQVNDQNKVPTSALAYAMNQSIVELNSDLDSVSDGLSLLSGIEVIDDCNNAGEAQKLTVNRYDEDTLNSPYKAGLTGSASAGFIFTMKNSVNYGMQVAYVSGIYNERGYILSRGLNGENNWLNWHPVTPYSNRQTSIAANYGLNLNITKVANTVTLSIYGRLTSIEAGTEYTIYTLPEEYRPFYSQYWNTYTAQSGNYAPFLVSANVDGSVKLNCTGGEVPTGYINIRYVYGIDY